MPIDSKIQVCRDGAVARVLLDKPDKLNALDEEMLTAIESLFVEWERSGEVAVALLGSTHPRAFCVGADIEVLSRMDEAGMQAWELMGSRVLDRVQNSPVVSVAVIGGHALGGGLTLAASCDYRVASDVSTFAQPEIELGWIPGWAGVARLARLVGPTRAKLLSMTARRLNAAEALEMGLIDAAVPGEKLEEHAANFAASLASRSVEALRAVKTLSDRLHPPIQAAAHQHDALLNAWLLKDPRGQAAIAAFLARKQRKESPKDSQ